MAGAGPVPKQQHQRERDTRRRQSDAVNLTDDGALRGPAFPYDVVEEPHPATLEWWETWRRSAQAQLFTPTDWQTLKRAARLQDGVMTAPRVSAQAVSELRLIEERFGATYVDRQRAKMHISRPDADATDDATDDAPVVSIVGGKTRPSARERMKAKAAPSAPADEDPAPF